MTAQKCTMVQRPQVAVNGLTMQPLSAWHSLVAQSRLELKALT